MKQNKIFCDHEAFSSEKNFEKRVINENGKTSLKINSNVSCYCKIAIISLLYIYKDTYTRKYTPY